jgi:hypothetical protein
MFYEELLYFEHALDENLEDHIPLRKESKQEICEEAYQTFEDE